MWVFFLQKGNTLTITNIVPEGSGQLSRQEYNAVIELLRTASEPVADRLGLRVQISSGRKDLSDILKPKALKAFRTFLLAANKSTGLAHPSDRERWFRFLIIAYKESIDLDSETLIRWLMEEERWPEDKAFELALNYEIGHELLNAYDHNRSR
jgi:hypothetical protein